MTKPDLDFHSQHKPKSSVDFFVYPLGSTICYDTTTVSVFVGMDTKS